VRYFCDFEGEYWDNLVNDQLNKDNLPAGTFTFAWYDGETDLAGEVAEPYAGYWEGVALSNYCSKDYVNNGNPSNSQLYAYVDSAYSGDNFLICNGFMSGRVELRFQSRTSFIESMMVANTTYSYAEVMHAQTYAEQPLGNNESIWIEAEGFINGSDEVQAVAKFYLYEKGRPSFEGWKKWYMTSMCRVDRVVMSVKWDGEGERMPYPAYFAIDNIVTVRYEPVAEK
jgi:hypothetical protein